MEPLKGGRLTDSIPQSIFDLWNGSKVKRTPAEWAFRWVADFPEVLTILSGMNSPEQLEENLRILSDAEPNSLSAEELDLINKVANQYNNLIQHSCTGCRYCLPCPAKIEIPKAIDLYNDYFIYEGNSKIKRDFRTWLPPDRRPSACITCRACEEKCPQHLPISDIMKKSAKLFE